MSLVACGNSNISVGPWGGQSGSHWDDGAFTTVRQLVIAHGAGIDSIHIEYDKNGTSVWTDRHGGKGGPKIDKVKLDYPTEFLTSIHGYYGSLNEHSPGSVCVRSLTFQSNKKTYGPYGVEQGKYFSLPTSGGRIVGFHGKSGWYLDAIGAYLEPQHSKQNPSNAVVYAQNYLTSGTDKMGGYSVIQGSLSNEFDVVLAIRHKNDHTTHPPSSAMLSRQIPKHFSDSDLPEKVKGHEAKNLVNSEPKSRWKGFGFRSSSDSESPEKVRSQVPKDSVNSEAKAKPRGVGFKLSNDSEVKDKMSHVPKSVGSNATGVVTYGAWGGSGGTEFDDGAHTGIREIHLSRNVGIVSIRVLYEKNGEATLGATNGGTGSLKKERVTLNYPYEILTHITGFVGPAMMMGPTIIRSLTFHTTSAKYGPFGDEQGQPFSTKLKEGKIVGIHGRKGLFLDAIGVHVFEGKVTLPPLPTPSKPLVLPAIPVPKAVTSQKPNNNNALVVAKHQEPNNKLVVAKHQETNNKLVVAKHQEPNNKLVVAKHQEPNNKLVVAKHQGTTNELAFRVVKEPAAAGPGPWGGEGGRPWDDGVFTGIKQISLVRNEAICSIQFEYDRNGQSVWSAKHGGDGSGGGILIPIKLEYPHEVVTCISGFYGAIKGKDERVKVIKSLTFQTSRRKCGPYGEEIGTYFTALVTEGKLVGFHGRCGMYLDAIGVHMQHWLGNSREIKPSVLKKIFKD